MHRTLTRNLFTAAVLIIFSAGCLSALQAAMDFPVFVPAPPTADLALTMSNAMLDNLKSAALLSSLCAVISPFLLTTALILQKDPVTSKPRSFIFVSLTVAGAVATALPAVLGVTRYVLIKPMLTTQMTNRLGSPYVVCQNTVVVSVIIGITVCAGAFVVTASTLMSLLRKTGSAGSQNVTLQNKNSAGMPTPPEN